MGKIVVKPGVKNGDDWTWETKVAVATALIDLGNRRLVAELSTVPYDTIRDWQKTDWWVTLQQEIKASRRAELNNKVTSIAEKALIALEDRLVNGDYILNNKTGEIVRKPVGAKEANSIAQNLLTQKIKMEEQEQTAVAIQESVPEMLKMIANEFAKINRKIDKSQATDISFVERI